MCLSTNVPYDSAHYCCSAIHGFWPMDELAELADGPTGSGETARGGCLFAWNISVTRSTVRTVAERRTRPHMTSGAALLIRSYPIV